MKNYILSIVIPTKNRQKYCLAAINQIISLNIKNVEICIQDNSDTDLLRNDISTLACDDIVYNYHHGILSFVDNFSEAVSLAHGEYMCMIGDDDGILPSIIEVVEHMKKNEIDSVIPSLGAVYFWPSENPIVKNGEKGVLTLSLNKAESRYTDSKRALISLLKGAVQNYTSLDIPRLYHGIVKRSCLENIKKQCGTYFDGLTPDMYMAVALCFVCKRSLRISYPVTISGICPTSGSSDSASGRHTGELKEAPHFRGHLCYHWEDIIPAFYSVDTIWAETLMKSLKKFGKEDMKYRFNLPLFEVLCLKKYPQFKKLILEHAKNNNITAFAMSVQTAKYNIRRFVIKCKTIFHPKHKQVFVGINDIEDACSMIIKQMK